MKTKVNHPSPVNASACESNRGPISQSLQNLLQSAMQAVIDEQGERLRALQARIDAIDERAQRLSTGQRTYPAYYSDVFEYCDTHRIPCDFRRAAQISAIATDFSDSLGAMVFTIPDFTCGQLKVFAVEILEAVCEELDLFAQNQPGDGN